jgi:hypothetical protein
MTPLPPALCSTSVLTAPACAPCPAARPCPAPLQSGTSLSRASRKTHPPKRPEGGWGLLVQPLGKAAREGRRKAYVAMPDGSQRPLTGDEQVHVERQQPRPRRKIA